MSEQEITLNSASAINDCHRKAQESAGNAVEYAIECGKLLAEQKAQLKHGEWKPWVEANCDFSYRTCRAYMQATKQSGRGLPFSSIAQLLNPERDSVVTKYTGKGDWRTPGPYVELVRNVLGDIDLDPASSVEANETVRAQRFYSIDDDGLQREWEGRVFLNPPYSQPEVSQFVGRLVESHISGAVQEAVLLTNNSTDTSWWQAAAKVCSAVCFTAGRINFVDDSGRGGNTNGQSFMYFGRNPESFCDEFVSVGWVGLNHG